MTSGYVGPDGPPHARLAIVGEAPGRHEEAQGRPFVGPSGHLLGQMLQEVGLSRGQAWVTNVARYRPSANDISVWFGGKQGTRVLGKQVSWQIRDGLRELYRELGRVRPNVICAMGNAALWALTGQWGVTKFRGSLMHMHPDTARIIGCDVKVIPTIHPAAILRKWEWMHVALHDLRRVRSHVASADWPDSDAQYRLTLRPHLHHVQRFFDWLRQSLTSGPTPMAVDVETLLGCIECVGIAVSAHAAIVIPFLDNDGEPYWDIETEAWIVLQLRELLTHGNAMCIGQNFQYDAQYFAKNWGFVPRLRHDTMVMQSVAFPGMLSGVMTKASGEKRTRREREKSLDMLASLYARDYRQWKLSDVPYGEVYKDYDAYWRYSALDVCYTFEVAEVLLQMLGQLGVRPAYDFQLQLWRHVTDCTLRGIRIDLQRKQAAANYLTAEIARLESWLEWVIPSDVWPRKPKSVPWYRSPAQKAAVFYEVLGQQPVTRMRKTARGYADSVTTDDEALETIAQREPVLRPVCEALLMVSKARSLMNNFIAVSIDDDGRIRGSMDIAGTETFRFAHRKDAFGRGTNLGNLARERGD